MNSEQFKIIQKFEQDFFWYKSRREIIYASLDSFGLLDPNKTVLEIGSANGENLEYFKNYYNVIKGIEINEDALSFSQKRLPDLEIAHGYLPNNLCFDNERFDLIFLFDVLEHVEEDELALARIHDRLKHGGHLILTVPAYQFLFSEFDRASYHFRRYNKTNLSNILSKAGFDTLYCSYFNFWLFPLVLVSRLITKLINKTSSFCEDNFKNSFTNKIFTKIMGSEKYLINKKINLPFGSSIISICKKN